MLIMFSEPVTLGTGALGDPAQLSSPQAVAAAMLWPCDSFH